MIPRTIAEKVLHLATKYPVISITGPRQSGKTTLVRQLFPDYTYVNLENPDDRQAAKEAPREFLNVSTKGIVIDEAQYVPEIFSYIQLFADEHKQNGEFILTGSQHFLFMEKITQSLAGRVAIFNLLPFSLQELQGTDFQKETHLDYILNGFFPRLYDQNIAPRDYFPNYLQTYVERDARQLVNISDLDVFQSFLQLCAGRVGQLFNKTEVGNLAGVDQATVRRWLSILKTGFQVFTLSPHFRNFNKRIVKTPKLYFYDTGMACALLNIKSVEELQNHFARGALFENFIIVEIMKSFFNKGYRPNLYFWRDRSGHEIDLLVDEGDKIYPIEIKAATAVQPQFYKGLSFFNTLSGNSPELSYLIYGGQNSYDGKFGKLRSWKNLPQFI